MQKILKKQQTKEEKQKMMLETPVSKLIMMMAIPTIVAQLITTIYNLADTYFVSTLGTNATAAVGVNSSLEGIIMLVAQLIGGGIGSYLSRLLGAQKNKEADRALSTSVAAGLLIGLVVFAAGSIFISPLADLLGATPECKEYTIQYATYVLMAAPFMITSFILNQSLRNEGSMMFAMIGIGFGGILNCFLDPLFIFYFGMGVKGASMATAISKVVSFAILLWPYLKGGSVVKISWKKIGLVKKDIYEVLSIGSASFFRSGTLVLTTTVMNHVAGGFSTSVLAAISVSNRVMQFPFAIILGFGQGYQPVVGFSWGAKRFDRAKKSLRFALISSFVYSVILALAIGIFAGSLIGLFTKTDEQMLALGELCIRLQCIALPIHACVSIINMLYAGIGKPKQALLLSTARQGYCMIPLLLIIPAILGEKGLTGCQMSADFITFFIALPLAVSAWKMLEREQRARENMLEETAHSAESNNEDSEERRCESDD